MLSDRWLPAPGLTSQNGIQRGRRDERSPGCPFLRCRLSPLRREEPVVHGRRRAEEPSEIRPLGVLLGAVLLVAVMIIGVLPAERGDLYCGSLLRPSTWGGICGELWIQRSLGLGCLVLALLGLVRKRPALQASSAIAAVGVATVVSYRLASWVILIVAATVATVRGRRRRWF